MAKQSLIVAKYREVGLRLFAASKQLIADGNTLHVIAIVHAGFAALAYNTESRYTYPQFLHHGKRRYLTSVLYRG